MKNIYINSRLHPLLVASRRARRGQPPDRLFSLGEPWLYLTPGRLAYLAMRLGRADPRIVRIVKLLRRHSPSPEAYCRRLGIAESVFVPPAEYPPALCPVCDNLHSPHPEDAERICPECMERERRAEAERPAGGELRDRLDDRSARRRLLARSAIALKEETVNPRVSHGVPLRVDVDWRKARLLISHGVAYRFVSREIGCALGKVARAKHWECN